MPFNIAFLICLVVLLAFAAVAGKHVSIGGRKSYCGILIDPRDRMSLNRFQIVLWTILVLSTFMALLLVAVTNGQTGMSESGLAAITRIPAPLLGLMGVSTASVTMAGAVKDSKNVSRAPFLMGTTSVYGANLPKPASSYTPRWMQLILEEEGQFADQIVSITKFQNLIINLAVVVVFMISLFQAEAWPTLDERVVYLIGISHAGYVGGKFPDKP